MISQPPGRPRPWLTGPIAAFDIRFSRDGILDRTTRSVHFGVLAGFSVAIMCLCPAKQDGATIRVTRLFAEIKETPVAHRDSHPDPKETLSNRMNNNIDVPLSTVFNSLFASPEIGPMREMVNHNGTRPEPQEETSRETGIRYAAAVRAGPAFAAPWCYSADTRPKGG